MDTTTKLTILTCVFTGVCALAPIISYYLESDKLKSQVHLLVKQLTDCKDKVNDLTSRRSLPSSIVLPTAKDVADYGKQFRRPSHATPILILVGASLCAFEGIKLSTQADTMAARAEKLSDMVASYKSKYEDNERELAHLLRIERSRHVASRGGILNIQPKSAEFIAQDRRWAGQGINLDFEIYATLMNGESRLIGRHASNLPPTDPARRDVTWDGQGPGATLFLTESFGLPCDGSWTGIEIQVHAVVFNEGTGHFHSSLLSERLAIPVDSILENDRSSGTWSHDFLLEARRTGDQFEPNGLIHFNLDLKVN